APWSVSRCPRRSLRGREWTPRVGLLRAPGSANPGVRWIGEEGHEPSSGAGHDVQVIHRVPGGGGAGTVIAPRHEERVAVANRDGRVDRAVVRVRAMNPVALPRVLDGSRAADPEVVDLLVPDGAALGVVVLVRRI